MLDFPHINPVAIQIGSIAIRWYSLAYIGGFGLGYLWIRKDLTEELGDLKENALNMLSSVMIGIILGGRLGYCLFYSPSYYIQNPIEIAYVWQGGMSYHGGAIGALLGAFLFAKKNKLNIYKAFDWVAMASTIGIFFGRLANFVNAELYGRITQVPWAMVFPGSDGQPRHPSQLYEAFGEGLILGLILWLYKRKNPQPGRMMAVYLMGYGFIRFLIEYTREPNAHIGLWMGLSRGQLLCVLMMILGGVGMLGLRHMKSSK